MGSIENNNYDDHDMTQAKKKRVSSSSIASGNTDIMDSLERSSYQLDDDDTFDHGAGDIEMQKQQMQQAQQQSCLSPKSIIYAGVGIAVIFGAIYTVIKMRNNHNQLFD